MKTIETEEDLEVAKHRDFQKAQRKGKHKPDCNCGYCCLDRIRGDLVVK